MQLQFDSNDKFAVDCFLLHLFFPLLFYLFCFWKYWALSLSILSFLRVVVRGKLNKNSKYSFKFKCTKNRKIEHGLLPKMFIINSDTSSYMYNVCMCFMTKYRSKRIVFWLALDQYMFLYN